MASKSPDVQVSQVLQDLEGLLQQQRQETLRMLRKRLEETFDGRSLLPGTVEVMRMTSLNSRPSNSKVLQALQASNSDELFAEDIEDSDNALDLPVIPKPVVKVTPAKAIPDTSRVGPPKAFPVPEDPSPNHEEKVAEKNSIKGGTSKPSLGTALTRKQTARGKMEQQMVLLSGDQMERLQFRRTWLQRFTSHWIYENVMSFLILANSLILGLQVQVLAEDAAKHAAQMRELPEPTFDAFFAMHWLFCIAFSADLTLRWWADGFWDFFQGVDAGWNIFDIFVVAFAIIDVIVDTAFLSSGSPTSVLNSRRSFTTLRVLRVVRIIRVLRVVRMLTFFRELRMMIHSTIGCFKSVFFVMILFGTMLYIFGIAFTSAFIDHMSELSMWQDPKHADLIDFFGSVTISGLSLYQAMSGGRDWHVFFQALETMEGQVWSYIFLFYTLVAIFAIVNIVAAVFVDSAMQFSKADHQLMVHQEVSNRRDFLSSLGELFQAIDIDDNGFITRDEFDECLKQEKFMAFFRAIKLDYRDAQLLFDLLDSDQSGKVTVDEFIDGCAKLQGEATALETKVLHLEVQMVRRQLERFIAVSGAGSFFCTSSMTVPTIKKSPNGGNSP